MLGIVAAAMAVLLAGCVSAPPPSSRVVSADPTTVRERVQMAMRADGLVATVRDDGTIVARSLQVPGDWARCPPVLVGRGGSNESKRMVTVRSRRVSLRVVLTPVGQATTIDVDADFSGAYDNPETAASFDRACRSTGVLEARLLAAAG